MQDLYSTLLLKDVVKRNSIRDIDLLERINDNYLKYVVTFDEFDMGRNEIIHKNIREEYLNILLMLFYKRAIKPKSA